MQIPKAFRARDAAEAAQMKRAEMTAMLERAALEQALVDAEARSPEGPEVAAALSAVTGRAVRRIVVDDEDWVADQIANGLPDPWARMLLSTYQATRRGEFAVTDPTLESLLGRPPQSIDAALRAAAGAET